MNHADPSSSTTRRRQATGFCSQVTAQSKEGSTTGIYGKRPVGVMRIVLIVLALFLHGCGEVEWFPEYVRPATTPDPFSFPTKTGVLYNIEVVSDPITVSGLTAESSPIKITGPAERNSKYSINNATATDTPGTVKNGDIVTVSHTTPALVEVSTTSTLSIGEINGTFTSITRFFNLHSVAAATTVGIYRQTSGTIASVDGKAGTHVISIRDSVNSGNAQYSVSDDNLNSTTFTNVQTTVPTLNGKKIYIRNLSSTVALPATTILTINGADFTVNLAP